MVDFKPNDKVKSCDFIERGIRFWTEGLCCCCSVTMQSPVIVTAKEMAEGKATPEFVAERRKKLFETINGVNDYFNIEGNGFVGSCAGCNLIKEKLYKDVNFDYLGGLGDTQQASSFNISHFSACNARCSYCDYTIRNDFRMPEYNNIIDFIEAYRKQGKFLTPNSIDYNGGEPTILPNFEEILNYLNDNKIGWVTLYSNCIKYSQALCDALANNKVNLITSLDCGTPTTYKKIHGVDAFKKSVDTIIRYRNSGTKNLIIKYNICKDNTNDDDLYGFVFLMASIRPNMVFICPEFPYGNMEIPKSTVDFGARMYYLLEKYCNLKAFIQTDVMKGDPKLCQYSTDIRRALQELWDKNPLDADYCLIRAEKIVEPNVKFKKLTLIQKIFSVRNEGKHKVFRILGIKIKFKRNNKCK